MKKIALGILVAFLIPIGAQAKSMPTGLGYGEPANSYDRTIVITPSTKWVNVAQDESVRFVIPESGGSKTVAWDFDTYKNSFDFDKIAPGVLPADQHVKVYVQSDDLSDDIG